MRIGMILAGALPPREGIGYYAWGLAKSLVQQGHQVQLITRGSARATWCSDVEGIRVWQATFLPCYPFHVHLHNLFVSRLVRRLEQDLDVLHLHSPLVLPPPTRLPILVTVHTPLRADIRSVDKRGLLGLTIRMQAPFSLKIEQELFNRADRLVAVASSVAAELSEYGIESGEVAVMGNGVDTDFFAPGLASGDQTPLYFLTVGRLAVRKGLEDLVEAAGIVVRRYPKVKFVLLGRGPLYGDLKRSITASGLADNIILAGHIDDRRRLLEYYQGALAYVHPAHYEGLPTVLLEAMACGQATVATAVSGALDVVSDGKNGLLVPPRQPEALASGLMRILEEPRLAARLGRNARATVCRRFSWKVVGEKYAATYQGLLDRR